jgi:two-component system KDP operon response regulator KdpE
MEPKAKILLIDDDQDLLGVLRLGLEQEDFLVVTATDGSEGLRAAYREQPDLIVLDIMMAGVDGWDTCRRLRELSDVPIIMLTAKTMATDVVKGLALGADDYVTKPFSTAELMARVHACLRRAASRDPSQRPATIVSGEVTIDLARRKVTISGEAVELTPTEFRLLAYLARNRGRVVLHQTLLREVWGPEYANELDYLRLYVSYLRRKIEKDPTNPDIIKTAWGQGYYIT